MAGGRSHGRAHCGSYITIIEWSRALGDVPILLHEANRPWVMRPDAAVTFWSGDTQAPLPRMTLIRTGGHFPGATVLHWDNAIDGADGQGVLFSGDVLSGVADRRWVTFMYSYPNDIPLDSTTVRRMADMLEPYAFDRIHDAFERHVTGDAGQAVARSAERYIRHVDGRAGPTI